MKNITKTILALGLAIALTFGWNTSLTASGFGVEQVEQGSGVIDDFVIDLTSTKMTVRCDEPSTLTVYSSDGKQLYKATVTSGVITIPNNQLEEGSLYVVLQEGNHSTVATFSMN